MDHSTDQPAPGGAPLTLEDWATLAELLGRAYRIEWLSPTDLEAVEQLSRSINRRLFTPPAADLEAGPL